MVVVTKGNIPAYVEYRPTREASNYKLYKVDPNSLISFAAEISNNNFNGFRKNLSIHLS